MNCHCHYGDVEMVFLKSMESRVLTYYQNRKKNRRNACGKINEDVKLVLKERSAIDEMKISLRKPPDSGDFAAKDDKIKLKRN